MSVWGDSVNVYKKHGIDNDMEGQWIDKVAAISKERGLGIKEIEEYDHGRVIRYSSPDNPSAEADVFVWYKRVEWLSETKFCSLINALFTTDKQEQKVKSILQNFLMNDEIVPGYVMEGYDSLTKNVDTPDEAVAEVCRIMPLRGKAAALLDGIVRDVRQWVTKRDGIF